jgi:hypothetical protein
MRNFLILLVIVVLVGGLYFYDQRQEEPIINLGGIGPEPYNSTSTTGIFNDPTTLKTGFGTFGSVVITIAGTAPIDFYDATTTDIISGNVARAATSSIWLAHFPASMTAGTYVFDVAFANGLLVDFGTGGVPTSTITFK